MGSACIKVTKYFLFLFNLLFFVSMTRASHGLRKRLSSWGHPSARPSSLGLVVGWGLRQTVGNGSRWGWKEIPSVPSWCGGRTLGPCPSLSLPRSSAKASGRPGREVGVGRAASFLSGPDCPSSSAHLEESACGRSGSQLPPPCPHPRGEGCPPLPRAPRGWVRGGGALGQSEGPIAPPQAHPAGLTGRGPPSCRLCAHLELLFPGPWFSSLVCHRRTPPASELPG